MSDPVPRARLRAGGPYHPSRPVRPHSKCSRPGVRSPDPHREPPLLQLQRLAGNRAVSGLLDGPAAVQREEPSAEGQSAGRAAELIDAAVQIAATGGTMLLADDVRDALEGRSRDPELAAEFDAALAHIDARSAEEGPIAPLNIAAGDIITVLERRFILDPKQSTLDLLGERRSRRYRDFEWSDSDFPGGTTGPHEARAKEMIGAMTRRLPERRPNSQAFAVIRKREVDRSLEKHIEGYLVPVEGQPRKKLHPVAAASFAEMRAAAAADGVRLLIKSANRTFEESRRRAKAAGNKRAIGDFSSHNLGLAVDLFLSAGRQKFKETSTGFRNVVRMTAAPAHKWMWLNGAKFGWYPYQHEPWHWEYNPPGFRAAFRESIGLPAEDEPDEAAGSPAPEGEGEEEEPETAVD